MENILNNTKNSLASLLYNSRKAWGYNCFL